MPILRTAFVLIMSYAAAAMLSSHVSMDIKQTEWTSLWVYFWWVISLPVTFGIFTLGAIAAYAIYNLFAD